MYSENEEVFEPEHAADESNLDRVGEELIPADCSALEEEDYPDFTAILTGDSDMDERLIRHKWRAVVYSRAGAEETGCPVCAGGKKGNRNAECLFSTKIPMIVFD